MSLIGADVEQVEALARRFEMASKRLAQVLGSASANIMVAEWLGGDIDKLRSEWNRSAKPRIAGSAAALSSLSTALKLQAAQQRTASAAAGGTQTGFNGQVLTKDGKPVEAPSTPADRWDTLVGMKPDDGIRIQEILCEDGTTRYVVYINGTGGADNGNLSVLDNSGQLGFDTQTRQAILDAMRKEIPTGAEVMLQGYSQGGIHAQHIALTGEFNVTDVVTYGSPYYLPFDDPNGPNIVRITDKNDRIPWAGIPRQAPIEMTTGLKAAFELFTGRPADAMKTIIQRLDNPDVQFVSEAKGYTNDTWLGSHTDRDTYHQGATQFEAAAHNNRIADSALESQSRYTGTVMSDTDAA